MDRRYLSADFRMTPLDFEVPDHPRKQCLDIETYEAERRREEESRNAPRSFTQTNGHAPGRVLPHSIEAEQYLLSSILLDGSDVLSRCGEAHIIPAWFYDQKHATLFGRLQQMQSKRIPIAIDTLAEELKAARELDQIGGYAFLTQISSRVPTTAQAGYFIEKVREQALLRDFIRTHTSAVEDAYAFTGDIDTYMAEQSAKLKKITAGANGIGPGVRLIDCQYPQKGDPQILLGEDDCLSRGGGWLIISYAGVGKSSWAMQMALNFGLGRPMFGLKSHEPRKVLIIQGEDSPRYIGKVASSFAEAEKLTEAENAMLRENVFVHELRGVEGDQFIGQVQRLVDKYNPDLCIINPAYLYVQGDINGLKDVKPWLQRLDGMNVGREKKLGWVIVHHTGKPTPKDNKGKRAELENWETVYMGTGSSAWANWPRLTAMLEPRASNPDGTHFWLKFGKGWKNTGIVREVTDEKGNTRIRPVNKIAIQYTENTMLVAGEQRPMVHWEVDEEGQKEADEKANASRENGKKGGRQAKFEWAFFRGPFQTAAPSEEKGVGYNQLFRMANDMAALSKSSFNIIIQKGLGCGELRRNDGTGKYWVPDGVVVAPGDGETVPAQWYQDRD